MVSLQSNIVDQREIQKKGGKATRAPSSYIVVSILRRHNLFVNVLDVTYGRGRFYSYMRPRILVGADPKVWPWIVKPDIFMPKPVWKLSPILKQIGINFSVIVCDPPFGDTKRYNKRDEYSFVVGSPRLIIKKTIELAKELGIEYMLLHYDKTIDWPIVEDVKFRCITRYLNNPNPRFTHFTLYKIS